MEAVLGRSGHGGLGVDEEIKRVESNGDEHASCKQDFALKLGKSRHEFDENEDIKRSSPKQKDQLGCSKDQVPGTADEEKSSIEPDSMASSFRQKKQENDQLESTRAEMGEVREENERLKMYLGQIMKDYQNLQMQFNNIVQQESAKESTDNSANNELEETELVSLSLGSFSANPKIKEENNKIPTKIMDDGKIDRNEKQLQEGSLSLGLDYKYNEASKSGATGGGGPAVSNPSAASSLEDQPKEEAGETWPPSKGLMKMAPKRSAEDEVSQQNPAKKARVCVRARCDTPTMNDGCQWRKYGQKISKGNPCPRAYYRCTVAPSCPVRKQVQRCADDMSILITTYEGTHNHPLPVSATAMASTTSAAASMLLSGSSTSSGHRPPTADQLPGFSTLDSSKWSMDKQFYLPNSSSSPYSFFSSSHPTITLDLTSTPSSSSSSSPLLNKFSSSSSSSPNYSLHYPSTSLSFGSSDSNNIMWSNNNINGFLSYGNGTTQTYNLKSQIGTLGIGRQTASFHSNNNNYNNVNYQNYMQKPNPSTSSTNNQVHSLPDTIAAATKAITADPTFQSALVAALTSIIGGGGGGGGEGQGVNNIVQGGGDHNGNNNVVQKLKWGGDNLHDQQFPVSSTSTTTAPFLQTAKGIGGCATTFLNKTAASANSQPAGNLLFLSPNSLSFSASKSASASPGDSAREQPS